MDITWWEFLQAQPHCCGSLGAKQFWAHRVVWGGRACSCTCGRVLSICSRQRCHRYCTYYFGTVWTEFGLTSLYVLHSYLGSNAVPVLPSGHTFLNVNGMERQLPNRQSSTTACLQNVRQSTKFIRVSASKLVRSCLKTRPFDQNSTTCGSFAAVKVIGAVPDTLAPLIGSVSFWASQLAIYRAPLF